MFIASYMVGFFVCIWQMFIKHRFRCKTAPHMREGVFNNLFYIFAPHSFFSYIAV